MDHVAHAAHQIDGIKHIDGLRAVRQGDCYSISLPHADGFQCLGTIFNFFHHFFVGGGSAHKIKCYIIGIAVCNIQDLIEHGAFKILQVHRDITHCRFPRGFYVHSLYRSLFILHSIFG